MTVRTPIPRREFLRRTSLGVGAALFASTGCASAPKRSKGRRPNIVFIIADDLGWADIGYHDSEIKTPHLDRLVKQSVRFDRHYVMPTCTPTRIGLMAGRYPSRFGVTSPAYGKIFDDDTVTLPAALRTVGYHTAIAGKWHMGSPPDYTPTKYGFDTSYGYFHGQIDPYTHHYKTGVRSWHRNDQFLEEKGHATDLITAEAVRLIESKPDKPFFLYVAYSVPHYPLNEPEKWTAMYAGLEPVSRRWYAASVTHMDAGIGQILEAVKRSGRAEDTLVVFVSDNGGQQSWRSKDQYHGRYTDRPHTVLGNNRPLRGWKGDLYEGGIRVPALACWPGMLRPGKVNSPVHIVDWMPTLCNLVGYHPDRNPVWDGRDVWPEIAGQTTLAQPRTLYWKTPGGAALRQGPWKLIALKNKSPQLFHLDRDPYETNDLAERDRRRVDELNQLLKRIAQLDRARTGGT